MYCTNAALWFILHTMLSGRVPRRINASTVMIRGDETAPTNRSVMAKLEIRMLEFVCNSLVFWMVTMTNVFKKVVKGAAIVVMAITSWRDTSFSKSQKNSGSRGQKITALEELTSESSLLLILMLTTVSCRGNGSFQRKPNNMSLIRIFGKLSL